MTDAAYFVDAFDGHRIAVRRHDPVTVPRAAIVVSHGMAEHGERYAPLAEFLGRHGFVVYTIDHRGHGRSIHRQEDTGHFADPIHGEDGWARVVSDLHHVIQHVRAAHPALPLVLFGHSMGSFIAQAATIAHGRSIDVLVLSGSNHDSPALYRAARVIARLEKLRQGPRGKSALLEYLSFGAFNKPFRPARTDYDWLSRDPAEVDKYVADPLCGFRVSNQLWIDLLGGLIAISQVKNLANMPHNLPVYLFGGDQDPVGRYGKGLPQLERKLREAGLRNVTTKLYEEGRHEMLNETNRAEVLADLRTWLDRTLR